MVEFPIKVENVVSVAVLGVDIPLEKMLLESDKTEYQPEQFPGLVYRPPGLRVAALIFSSGKIVCTGANSTEASKEAVYKVVEKIKEIGVLVPDEIKINVENIVAGSKINAVLKLEDLALSLENAEYEPSQFPGLVYKINDPKASFLLFTTGKIICTGTRRVEDVKRGLKKLASDLKDAGVNF